MQVLKPRTPQHLEMCQTNKIYRTFYIVEIRVWVSTEGVSTEGVFVFCFLFFFFILPIARGTYYLHKPFGWK